MNEVALLEELVCLRFKTPKEIVEKYKEILEKELNIKDILIVDEEKQELIENPNINFLTIPVLSSADENWDSELADYNFMSTLNIWNELFLDIDFYYLKDKHGNFVITEVWFERQ